MHHHISRLSTFCHKLVKLILIIPILILAASCETDPNFMTPQLKGLKLGVSIEDIKKRIKGSGEFKTKEITRDGRAKLTWIPYDKRKFPKIEFEFTEKNRLYLARFYISEQFRFNSQKIKDDFFDYFKISYEYPSRLRIKDSDVILYAPVEKAPNFFDFTDVVTGKKSFEVFNRAISATDRSKKLKLKDSAKKPQSSSSNGKPPPKAKEFLSLDTGKGNDPEKKKGAGEKD